MPVDEAALAASLAGLLAAADSGSVSTEQALVARLEQTVTAANDVLDVTCVGVLLLDERNELQMVGASGPVAAALESAQARLGVGPGVDGVTAAQTITVTDLSAAPQYASLWEAVSGAGVRAVLSAPVRMLGQVIGNLNAVHARAHDWTPAEISAAEAYADLIGVQVRLAAQARRASGLIAQLQDQIARVDGDIAAADAEVAGESGSGEPADRQISPQEEGGDP